MERRNSPTPLNYIASANQGIGYEAADIKGLQIKQPFQNAGNENAMIFEMPTVGLEDPQFSFAVKDEGAANAVIVEYRNESQQWQPVGTPLPIGAEYALHQVDLTGVAAADDNPTFAIRVRFDGSDMTAYQGNRVTFNNIALHATPISLDAPSAQMAQAVVFPNPTQGMLNIAGMEYMTFKIFTADGRLVMSGPAQYQIDLEHLQTGLYILQLESAGGRFVKKIARR